MTGAEFDQESTEAIGEPTTRAGGWRRKRVLLSGVVALALLVGLLVFWF